MENTTFNIKYNPKMDRLEFPKERKWNRFLNFINNHKFFSLVCASFLILSIINFYLIFNFMRILENI